MKFFYIKRQDVEGKPKKEVVVYHTTVLPPDGSLPLPDDKDKTVVDSLKICLRPSGCKKWSEAFKLSSLKNKLACDNNIMWTHYKTYSILRKEATQHKEVFNYYILPALIIKNCLPMPILMTLSHYVDPDAVIAPELNDPSEDNASAMSESVRT